MNKTGGNSDPPETTGKPDALEKSVETAELCDFYGDLLSDKQLSAVRMWCEDDMSLAEIAQACGITRAGAHDRIVKSIRILDKCEAKLGVAQRFRRVRSELEELRRLCAALPAGEQSEEIIKAVDRIIADI